MVILRTVHGKVLLGTKNAISAHKKNFGNIIFIIKILKGSSK